MNMPSNPSGRTHSAGSHSPDVENFLNRVEQDHFGFDNSREEARTSDAIFRKQVNFRKLTRRLRAQLSLKLLKSGRILDVLRLTIITDIGLSAPGQTMKVAHLLKDMGHSDLALRYFMAAARMAQTGNRHTHQSGEAIFNLAHCAKIAGNYTLACEAFACVAMMGETGSPFAKACEHELRNAVTSLTNSFVITNRAGP